MLNEQNENVEKYHLGLRQLIKLCKDHQMDFNQDDVFQAVQMTDEDRDGKITCDDFVSIY